MNWFQIVFLCEHSHEPIESIIRKKSCELISNCIFMWAFTWCWQTKCWCTLLWIDFKLYFYVSIHMLDSRFLFWIPVVNWFQIVFLCEHSHGEIHVFITPSSCELISNCIFMWAFTCGSMYLRHSMVLWIDFKLYFYVSIHMMIHNCPYSVLVVNWFQIVFLCEHSHVNLW